MKTDTFRTPFINLTQDLMFKHYFKHSKPVLISLLKAFLPLSEGADSIQDLTILDPSPPPFEPESKNPIMDIRVQLKNGDFVNVEMQAVSHPGFKERALFYRARNYGSQLSAGDKYHELCPSYSLIFTSFRLFPEREDFYTSFSIRSDQAPYFQFNRDLRFVTVELEKFRKREVSDLLDLREEWRYFLKESKRLGERDEERFSRKESEMKKAMSHLKTLSLEESLRWMEEARERNWKDQAAWRDDALEQGLKEGMQKGMKQGIQKGMQQVALNMLKEKTEMAFICKVTGLSEEEIKKLSVKNQNEKNKKY